MRKTHACLATRGTGTTPVMNIIGHGLRIAHNSLKTREKRDVTFSQNEIMFDSLSLPEKAKSSRISQLRNRRRAIEDCAAACRAPSAAAPRE